MYMHTFLAFSVFFQHDGSVGRLDMDRELGPEAGPMLLTAGLPIRLG